MQMKRLAIYAHFGSSAQVAGYVLFYLEKIAEIGFRICFVTNSGISTSSEIALKKTCERIIVRENTGLDFSMWQRGLAEYEMAQWDELLLTNSSIIGPLQQLDPLWHNPALLDCDFWGLTEQDKVASHLQSYFLVFRSNVIRSECFKRFWSAVLPYRSKDLVIHSYEIGISSWLEQHGFRKKAVFPQQLVLNCYRQRVFPRTYMGRAVRLLKGCKASNYLKERNTTWYYPDILHELGMPFLKCSLLKGRLGERIQPSWAYEKLREAAFPVAAIDELRAMYSHDYYNV